MGIDGVGGFVEFDYYVGFIESDVLVILLVQGVCFADFIDLVDLSVGVIDVMALRFW